MNLSKETQIILAVGVIGVGLYGVNQLAKGANQAEASAGSGIEFAVVITGLAGAARILWPLLFAA